MKIKNINPWIKVIISFVLFVIILLSFIGAETIAFKNRSEKTYNKIEMGNISARLVNLDENGEDMPEEGIFCVYPSQTYKNTVYVQNKTENAIWARIKVIEYIEDVNGDRLAMPDIKVNYNLNNWEYRDGYYYLNEPISGNTESPLFYDQVHFGSSINNTYKLASYYLELYLETVQVANNANSVFDAEGWVIQDSNIHHTVK